MTAKSTFNNPPPPPPIHIHGRVGATGFILKVQSGSCSFRVRAASRWSSAVRARQAGCTPLGARRHFPGGTEPRRAALSVLWGRFGLCFGVWTRGRLGGTGSRCEADWSTPDGASPQERIGAQDESPPKVRCSFPPSRIRLRRVHARRSLPRPPSRARATDARKASAQGGRADASLRG